MVSHKDEWQSLNILNIILMYEIDKVWVKIYQSFAEVVYFILSEVEKKTDENVFLNCNTRIF